MTPPARRRGRGRKTQASPVATLAEEAGLPLLQPETVRDEEFLARLRAVEADVFLVVSYGELLRQEFLDIPREECLNVHPSLLPRWRGATPIQTAILEGDAETGVSIQRVVLALDAGDVLAAVHTPIEAGETAGELAERLAELSGELVVQALQSLADGSAVFTPQDEADVTHCKKLQKEDGSVDWSRPAEALVRPRPRHEPLARRAHGPAGRKRAGPVARPCARRGRAPRHRAGGFRRAGGRLRGWRPGRQRAAGPPASGACPPPTSCAARGSSRALSWGARRDPRRCLERAPLRRARSAARRRPGGERARARTPRPRARATAGRNGGPPPRLPARDREDLRAPQVEARPGRAPAPGPGAAPVPRPHPRPRRRLGDLRRRRAHARSVQGGDRARDPPQRPALPTRRTHRRPLLRPGRHRRRAAPSGVP